MTQELIDQAGEFLENRGFKDCQDASSLNCIEMERTFGKDKNLRLQVWARHWSGLIVQINHPDQYESGIELGDINDIEIFRQIVDNAITFLEAQKKIHDQLPISG